ncbi:hypothetical protein JTE90_014401 [Oedothorax gibbosus]|uniref:MRH domain-containing protein n=1 Tax=Oedothorax gibbosus TaxID=931172 RepID=A0AAV6V5I8_9ARAC|nr:hypothetical protein JTE90_014401 [Oedothorax gibbosus]
MQERKLKKDILNILKPLFGSTFETKDDLNPDKYTYKVSICSQIQGQPADVGAIQIIEDTKDKTTKVLGKFNQVSIKGGTDWVFLTYNGGDPYHDHCGNSSRKTHVMIVCDPDDIKGSLQILEERRTSSKDEIEDECYYLFELSTNVTCPLVKPKPTKLSSGSVFCILFFTGVSVYLLCGFLYKRIVIGAKGMEQIPNYTFWREFGNLQADGCDYFCRWGSRQESHAYRGIDEHLKEEEERDDQLLNM